MKKETLEALHNKGLINKNTYEKGIAKYANGGGVLNPAIANLISPQTTQTPMSTPVAPEIQEAAQKAAENTVEQTAKMEAQPDQYATYRQALKDLGPNLTQQAVEEGRIEAPPSLFKTAILDPIAKFREENIAKVESLGPSKEEKVLALQKPETGIQLASDQQGIQIEPAKPKESPYTKIAEEYDKAYKAMEQSYDEQALGAEKTANAMVGAYNTALNDMKAAQKADQAAEQANKARLDDMTNKYQAMVDDYKQSAVVDPHRYWANKSDSDKTMARISIFLGGIGGGTNEVLNQINRNIDRDIDAQKSALDKKTTAMAMQNNIFKQMMDLTQNERAARLATKNAMLNTIEMQIKKAEAGTASYAMKAKAEQLKAQLGIEKTKAQTELLKEIQNSPAGLSADQETRQIGRLPQNLQPEAYKELGRYRQTMADVNMVRNTLQKISDISLAGRLNPADRDAVDTYKTQLIKPIKSMLGEAMQEADVKRLIDPLIPSSLSGKKDAQRKTDVFIQNLLSTLPEKTPILTGQGIIQPNFMLNLKRND